MYRVVSPALIGFHTYRLMIPERFLLPSTFLTVMGRSSGLVGMLYCSITLEWMNDPSAPESIKAFRWRSLFVTRIVRGILIFVSSGFRLNTRAILTVRGSCLRLVPLIENPEEFQYPP